MPPNPNEEYRPPLDDIWFALEEIADLAALAKLPSFQHADPELLAGVVDEAGRFVAEVVAPLNRLGDEQQSRRHRRRTRPRRAQRRPVLNYNGGSDVRA
jgi:hypothetical protein